MALLPGCAPKASPPVRLQVLPKADAIRIVNENTARIAGTLRATGSVDGYFSDANGKRRSVHLDGVLFYLAPQYLRFDLKSLGERQVLLGSNAAGYWFYSAEDKSYHCSEHGRSFDLPTEIPVAPDQMIEAFGLQGIPQSSEAIGPVQRVEGEYQQLVFLVEDEAGSPFLEKEYWLDQAPPRLIRRVLFRNPEGVLQMHSLLDNYRVLGPGGPLLPFEMSAEWPENGTQIHFRISQWRLVPQVVPGGPQFATPAECRGSGDEESP